jgi:hypothetical protein
MIDQILVLILILIIWARTPPSTPDHSPALNFSYRLSMFSPDSSPRSPVIELGSDHYRLQRTPGAARVGFLDDSTRSIRESFKDQGEFFHVIGLCAPHLPRKIQILMIPASIESIPAHSCSDAADLQGFSFDPSSVLRILSGFERSGLTALKIPPTTKLIIADAFTASKHLVSLGFSSPPALHEIAGFRACGRELSLF